MTHVIVIGGGPAGLVAALRARDLGARTTLVTSGEFGGMASNDGPVPVRTLAHAARLVREARQLDQYELHRARLPWIIRASWHACARWLKTFAGTRRSAHSWKPWE